VNIGQIEPQQLLSVVRKLYKKMKKAQIFTYYRVECEIKKKKLQDVVFSVIKVRKIEHI